MVFDTSLFPDLVATVSVVTLIGGFAIFRRGLVPRLNAVAVGMTAGAAIAGFGIGRLGWTLPALVLAAVAVGTRPTLC